MDVKTDNKSGIWVCATTRSVKPTRGCQVGPKDVQIDPALCLRRGRPHAEHQEFRKGYQSSKDNSSRGRDILITDPSDSSRSKIYPGPGTVQRIIHCKRCARNLLPLASASAWKLSRIWTHRGFWIYNSLGELQVHRSSFKSGSHKNRALFPTFLQSSSHDQPSL